MARKSESPRIEGDELVIATEGATETYDAKYLVAALLVIVAKGDGNISGQETAEMLQLVGNRFELQSSESLELISNALEDNAENPEFENLLRNLSSLLSVAEKEEVALMMLKVVAADGRRDAEELDRLRDAADLIELPAETMHRAYDRYFAETQV